MKFSIIKFVIILSVIFYSGCKQENDNVVESKSSAKWNQVYGLQYLRDIIVSGTNLFAAAGNDIFLSSDNGLNWVKVDSGLSVNTTIYSIAVRSNEAGNNYLFAGTSGGHVYLSTNNGISWSLTNTELPIQDVWCLAMKDSILFAGLNGAGVFRSTNNGLNWTLVKNGFTTNTIWSLAVCGVNLFGGTNFGVFHSSNNGNTWALADSGLKYNYLDPPWVGDLAASGTKIFAGVVGGYVCLSTDEGTSWTRIRTGQADEGQSSTFVAVSDSNVFVGTNKGVFLSTNNGKSWITINDDLSNTIITMLAVIKNTIFIETSDGKVWRRSF